MQQLSEETNDVTDAKEGAEVNGTSTETQRQGNNDGEGWRGCTLHRDGVPVDGKSSGRTGACIKCLGRIPIEIYLDHDFVCCGCNARTDYPMASPNHFTDYSPIDRIRKLREGRIKDREAGREEGRYFEEEPESD
jgi:hypothetical protein